MVRPFEAKAGPIVPWFDQPGMGTQFFADYKIKDIFGKDVPATVENLLNNSYIKKP
ncbi:glycohydrolase toxin TNT-related protein [Neobacillus muris]|uniref:glycohydrolase toxin TNT-related protein n=1 Tax=Neobacillus muris TaxID=2941334 RepID=UPI002040BCD0|nr:glycohydrolase toxin TNT-related protein [Neobacillus muris]